MQIVLKNYQRQFLFLVRIFLTFKFPWLANSTCVSSIVFCFHYLIIYLYSQSLDYVPIKSWQIDPESPPPFSLPTFVHQFYFPTYVTLSYIEVNLGSVWLHIVVWIKLQTDYSNLRHFEIIFMCNSLLAATYLKSLQFSNYI